MKHALKEIKYNWKKYLMVETLVVLLIFMVIFLTGLANGLGKALSAGVENLNSARIVLNVDAEKMIGMSRIPKDLYQKVLSKDANATPLIIQHGLITKETSTEKLDVTFFAVDPQQRLNPNVIKGSKLDNTANTVIIDESMSGEGVEIGDTLYESESGMSFVVRGFAQGETYSHTPIAFISLDSYETMLRGINENAIVYYNALAVDVTDLNISDLEILEKHVVVENMPGYLAEQLTIKMIIWVLVIVSAAILAVFFYILTIQKLKQFGVMKAIGFSMGYIAAMQFIQIAFISILGAILAYVIAVGLGSMMPTAMPFYIEQSEILFVSGAYVVIAIVSSMISIVNVAKIDANSIIGGAGE